MTRLARCSVVAAVATGLVVAVGTAPADAGPAPGLCTMNTARGAVPDKFPIDACVDGSRILLRNGLPIALTVRASGSISTHTTKHSDIGLAADATRAAAKDPWLLLPGDTMTITLGTGRTSVAIRGSSKAGFYALATTVSDFLPGAPSSILNAFTAFIAEIDADFANYDTCKAAHRNWLDRTGCSVGLSGNLAFAVGRAGATIGTHGVLNLLLSSATFVKWANAQPGAVKALHDIPPINQAAVGSATQRVVVAPVDAYGHPMPGWTVNRQQVGQVYCDDGGKSEPSAAAVSGNIFSCSPSANNAWNCWPTVNRSGSGPLINMLCFVDPWSHTLSEQQVVDNLTLTGPPKHPYPLALELAGGDRCIVHVDGAWDPQQSHPGWPAFFGCSDGDYVWGPPSQTGIDTSTSSWQVEVGRTTGPLHKVAVSKAYYASTGNLPNSDGCASTSLMLRTLVPEHATNIREKLCIGPWTTALFDTPNEEVGIWHYTGSDWQRADRGKVCQPATLPAMVYIEACIGG